MERDPGDIPLEPDDLQRNTTSPAPKVRISALFGSLKDKTTVRLSIEEINRIAADGWTGQP
jgi:predicted nucleic acid-binding Zn ribbon protein|nr:hypothetical protein [uncultured Rhodopila sp.]